MPVVALVFGGLNFSSKFFLLADVPEGYEGSLSDYAALKAAGVPVLGYGAFITQTVNFIILAFIIFLMVKLANRLIEKKPAAPAATPADVLLQRESTEARRGGNGGVSPFGSRWSTYHS